MKVAVTGSQGFIGSYVVEELQKRGHEVLGVDHHRHEKEPNHEVFLGDVRDATAMVEVAAHVDAVIHLAAVLGTQETISNPRPSAETNLLGGLAVAEACSQYDIPMVYAGVGNHFMRNGGTGAYTITKTAFEDFTRMYNKYRGANFTVVRPVNAYGPRQSIAHPYGTSRVRKVMPAFICRALTGSSVEIYGSGNQVSDCVFVEDVARTFVTALEHTKMHGHTAEPVGCGPSVSATVNEVAQLVIDAASLYTGARVNLAHLPMRPGEIPESTVCADTSTLAQIGMSAEDFVPLETGISRTVFWFANNWLPSYLEKAA